MAEGEPGGTPKAKPRIQVSCLRCRRSTWHEVEHTSRVSDDDDEAGWWACTDYQVIRCCGCDQYSFRVEYEDATFGPDDISEQLWPPRARKRDALDGWSQLPGPLSRVYRETNLAVSADQPVLAAVGVRAIVEAVCRHKKARGRNLKQRIDNLVARGTLTKAQARVLHKTCFLGNQAAHEAKPTEPKVLDAAMRIAEHMLTSVYLLPKLAKGMKRK